MSTGIRTFRNPEFIRIKHFKTDTGLKSPFDLACTAFNHAALFVDPTLPFVEFRSKVLRLPDSAYGILTKLN